VVLLSGVNTISRREWLSAMALVEQVSQHDPGRLQTEIAVFVI
jgi:hypothetical protein